jgi:hypothetical protein
LNPVFAKEEPGTPQFIEPVVCSASFPQHFNIQRTKKESKKMKRGLYLFIVLALLLALPLNIKPAFSQSDGDSITRDTLFVPGQVILGFDENVDVKAVPAQAAALAGEVQAAVLEVEGSMALLEFAPGHGCRGADAADSTEMKIFVMRNRMLFYGCLN